MNYSEMQKNKTWLDDNNFPNELFVSNNKHIWPSEDEILKAFDWFEIEKLNTNKTANEKQLLELKTKYINVANELITNNKLDFGIIELERLLKKFGNDKKIKKKKKKSKAYKSEISK